MCNESHARIQVFWQPGCSSCLRTKEFLAKHGIEFESVNVHNNPAGIAALRSLGARSVPVVAVGNKFTLCQSFDDVIRFLGLNVATADALAPEALVDKLALVLSTAAQYVEQFPHERLRVGFRDRNRTGADTAYHVFRVAEMALQAAQQIELKFEGFDDVSPKEWTATDIADWGLSVRKRFLEWWDNEADKSMQFTVPTYYGRHTMHNVMERTTWHAAHHTRQLALMLTEYGVTPFYTLTAEDLKGLPVPENVWDN